MLYKLQYLTTPLHTRKNCQCVLSSWALVYFYVDTWCVPKVSVLIFYLIIYWTYLKLQVISFEV